MPNRRELGYVSSGNTQTIVGQVGAYGVGAGGTATSITVGGSNYNLYTFTSDGNFVVSTAGLFDVLMFGGGAGGGGSNGSGVAGGGGGAGAFTEETVYLEAATYAIDIGAGGAGGTTSAAPTNGSVSSLGTTARSLCAIGGGYGGWFNGNQVANDGGCGGGGTYPGVVFGLSLSPTVGGFDGGLGSSVTNVGQAGGGGVTQAGQVRSGGTGGAGGAGYDVSAFIGDSALFKGGGGGGGGYSAAGGAGGSSVGGAGGNSPTTGSSAAANTGSGGGGVSANSAGSGGAGGSGIVYIRSKTSAVQNLSGYGTASGGTSSTISVGGQSYTLLSFTSDANLTVSTGGLFDVLLFGGGGGGGSSTDNGVSGGGGGAGGFLQSTVYLPPATYAVDIGAGGVGTSTPTNGLCSSIGTTARSLAVSGGGSGGGYLSASGAFPAGIGGCGGGGAYQPWLTGAISALPTVGGFAGGTGTSSSASAAGGGGVTAVGEPRGSASVGGAGGAGYDVSAFIGGSALFKGGGGGGAGSTTGGAGGSSVGGAGGSNVDGSAAAANTAGGGGGGKIAGAGTALGGSGGSGIVYVRFKI